MLASQAQDKDLGQRLAKDESAALLCLACTVIASQLSHHIQVAGIWVSSLASKLSDQTVCKA